jgi:RHS repeat-associated protein
MGFSFKIDGTGSASITMYDETGTEYLAATASGSTIESDTGTAWMIPGKSYTLTFWGYGPPDYTMSFIAPTGYSVYVNGVATNLVARSPGTGWHLENYTVELRPGAGEAGGMWGEFSGIQIGKAIAWGVGLGDLRTGRSAGGIQFKNPDLSGSPASRKKIYYAAPPANVGQVVVVYDGPSSTRLRQVCTPIGLTDLVDVTGGYEIRCYSWGQVASWTGSMYTFSGSPWKTIKVESPRSSQLKITETQGAVVRVSNLTGSGCIGVTGGTASTSGSYTLRTFNSSGTLGITGTLSSVDYLVVGGGGGGGNSGGSTAGGGGGGDVETGTTSLSSGSYAVVVGAGGSSTTNGVASSFNSIAATGGGLGSDSTHATSGGSGGGGGANTAGAAAGTGSNAHGGGTGDNGGHSWTAGGGGGAGVAGGGIQLWPGAVNFNGGDGIQSSISGTATYYGGGGGGGAVNISNVTTGGQGGGGAGGWQFGNSGTANSGGGGGGAGNGYNGGSGGSGVVIVRYPTANECNFVWTLTEGDGTTVARTTTHTNSSPAAGQRDDVAAVYNGNSTSSGNLVTKIKYHYVSQSWGEELGSMIADPDTAALATSFTYYTNSTNLGNYRRVQSVTQPTGDWTVFQYYDDWDRRGQLQYQIKPWLDSPSAATSASTTTGHVIYFQDYVADWTGRHTRPTVRQELINNVLVGKTSWSHGDNTGSGEPRAYMTVSSYRDGTNYQTDYVENYRADADPDFAGEPYQAKFASQAQDSVSISRGTFNTTTKAFSVGSTGDHWREMHFHGSTNSSGASAVTGWASQTCPSVYMIPNQSTLDVTIRIAQGYVYRTETWVYTGSGSFSLMTSADYTFDGYGNLTQSWASNGALTNNTFTDGRRVSTLDPSGIETDFTYDVLGRVVTSVKKGGTYGSYSVPGDITTTATLDAANHATQTVMSGSSHSLTATSSYDPAGRLYQTVAPGSYTTAIAYSSGARVVTTTLPGGATKITEVYPDGHAKSVTGTSVVAQYFGYTVNSSPGTLTTQTTFGTSTSTNLVNATTDWLGRAITEVRPAWSSGNGTKTWTYDGTTGLLTKLAQTGLADTLYSYDTLGNLFQECLDVGGNGAIDPASSDRITEHGWTYFTSSSNWWLRKTTNSYATTGSGTKTQTGMVETQLSGLPTNRLSVDQTTDIYGNVTTQTVDVVRGSKLVTTTATYPDSSTSAVQVAYNGLTVSSTDKANLTTTCGFDDLGRPVTTTNPRTGATTTAYVSGTSQVYTVTDPASVVQATYTYDSAGRAATLTNALSKVSRSAYTDRNEPYRVWGDTDYPVQYGYDNWGHQTTMATYRGGSGWTGSTWPTATAGTADTTTWAFQEATGLLSSKTDANAKSVAYAYTQARQLYTRTTARGLVTTYAYDGSTGEQTGISYSDSTPGLTYTFNRLGQNATVVDVTGTRTFIYNLTGTLELSSEDLPAYFGTRRITYPVATSGVIGRSTGLQLGTSGSPTAAQSVTYGYDASGRLNSFAAGGQTFSYGYTSNSNLVATVTNSGANFTDTRTYDSTHNWIDDRKSQVSSTIRAEFAYTQDTLGRTTQVAKTSGTGGLYSRYGNGTEGLTTYYGYDDRSQLTSEVTKVGTSSTVLTGRNDSAYAYDSIGNRTSGIHNGNTSTYTTNLLNQYTQRTVPGVFDVAGAAGTGTTVTVTRSGGATDTATRHGQYFFDGYDLTNSSVPVYATLAVSDGTTTTNLPAYLAKTAEVFTYDDDGNLLTDGRWSYTYDGESRLATMETISAAVTAGVTRQKLTFAYDYLGRRISKVVQSGWTGSSYATTDLSRRFIYNGWNLMVELDHLSSDAVVSSHFWGLDLAGPGQTTGGIGALLLTQEGGNSYLPLYDGNGNIHGMITAGSVTLGGTAYSAGDIVAAYEYDAFGTTLRMTGGYVASNPFRYSTKYTDDETALVYYGRRFYSPSQGRFIGRDPTEEKGGLHLYAFCLNNAINRYDYLGMNPFTFSDFDAFASVEDRPTTHLLRHV